MSGYQRIGAVWYGHPVPDWAVWALLACCAALMLTAILSSRYARGWGRRLVIAGLCAAAAASVAVGWVQFNPARHARLAAAAARATAGPTTVSGVLVQSWALATLAGTLLLFALGTWWARRGRGGRGRYRAAGAPAASRYPLAAAPARRGRRG